MFRNYLAAALCNLSRNRLYAAINIVGLSVGFAAALLIAFFVREELSYDRWLPGYERTYLMGLTDNAALRADIFPPDLAPALKLDFPGIEAEARLSSQQVTLRHGDVENYERLYWADPEIFQVLPLPAVAGELKDALVEPNSVVITRSIARKYFGRENVVGETLEINRQYPMTITAVLEDLPSNTHLDTAIIASARASPSPLSKQNIGNELAAFAYVRLKPGASVEAFRRGLADFLKRHTRAPVVLPSQKPAIAFAVPITGIHLGSSSMFDVFDMKPKRSPALIEGAIAIGLLIVLVASINFVNLMTAWAGRRAIEVGVRKVSGAERRDLIVQFIGEALLYVCVALGFGVALVALLAPHVQAYLVTAAIVREAHEPAFLLGLVAFAGILGVIAGSYPAFVLSAFRPAGVLTAGGARRSASAFLRSTLATVQFAILIGLIVATVTINNQLRFAFSEGLRMEIDQALVINAPCRGAFKDEVAALAGVKAIACSDPRILDRGASRLVPVDLPDGTKFVSAAAVGPGYFALYGVNLLAGREFSDDRGDEVTLDLSKPQRIPARVVINEAAVRKFGFASANAAIGRSLPTGDSRNWFDKAEIVGVVPDFSLDSIKTAIAPTLYFADPAFFTGINVKLAGRDIPETLAAIDRLWRQFGEPRPIERSFVDQRLQDMYRDIVREEQVLTAFAGVVLFIACLGLFGLCAFTAERRTKEIGVRKALGASRGDVLRLILWEFMKPVLLANAIAWPVGYVVMRRWLEGFAYHIGLAPWVFLSASALALVIAVATVIGHVLAIARAQPVTALRYE